MGSTPSTCQIQLQYLKKLQQTFQKDSGELIDIFLNDITKKIAVIQKAFEKKDWPNLKKELEYTRYRSIEIGAIQFSHYCLSLELAVQEMQIPKLPSIIEKFKVNFLIIQKELESLKTLSPMVT